jgi:hypothetical protein
LKDAIDGGHVCGTKEVSVAPTSVSRRIRRTHGDQCVRHVPKAINSRSARERTFVLNIQVSQEVIVEHGCEIGAAEEGMCTIGTLHRWVGHVVVEHGACQYVERWSSGIATLSQCFDGSSGSEGTTCTLTEEDDSVEGESIDVS